MGRKPTESDFSPAITPQSDGAMGKRVAWKTPRRSASSVRKSEHSLPQLMLEQVHKMSQPLTALQGTVELALFSEHTVEGYRAALEESLEQLTRLSDIVSSLRDLVDAHVESTGTRTPVIRLSVSRGPFEEASLAVEVAAPVRAQKRSRSSLAPPPEERSRGQRETPGREPRAR